MKRVALFLGLVTLSGSLSAVAQQGPRSRSVIDALRTARPGVTWDAKSSVVADVTCDGKADTVVVGYEGKTVWLGVVPGSGGRELPKPLTVGFPVGQYRQDSFCAVPVKIEVGALECRNEEMDLPGCKPVKGCSGFSLVDVYRTRFLGH